MGEAFNNIVGGVAAQWGALGPGQKFIVLTLGLAAVATVVISLVMVNHISYSVLYAGISPDQASLVVDKLQEMKTPYRLEDGGRTILVPEEHLYDTRLEMASEGGPVSGNSGYEIFDKSRFGMTSFMQQMNLRRALEGELTRTILEMDEVMAARVHLVIPEKTLFIDGRNETSASVMIRVKPGVHLTRRQVTGVARLVSGSVEGLEPESVNILDYYGTLLSTGGEDGFDAGGQERFEAEATLARALQEKAQTLLDRMVGPGNSIIRITTELDFERMERDSESYDPDNASVRSEEVSEETGGTGGEFRNSVTNYELNKTIERTTKSPGSIERLTVAVTVGGRYELPEGAAEDAVPQFVPRSAAELQEIASLIKNAVGIDESRGDQFHIACVELDREHLQVERAELKKLEKNMMIEAIIRRALLILGALVIFLILKKIFGSVAKTLSEAAPIPVAPQAVAAEVSLGAGAGTAAEVSRAAGPLTPGVQAEVASVADRVSELAREKPEESAGVIRTMLAEDD